MMTAGCDVGSLTSKAVVLVDGRVRGSAIVKSGARPAESAEAVLSLALRTARLDRAALARVVGTGYGRTQIPFADEVFSEITCHGRGARFLLPTARTVIDIGGQDCKVMRLGPDGEVAHFVANDKCASGTGRFLEVMARVLGTSLDQLGALSARSRAPVSLANACTVWAQADVIRFLADGAEVCDLAAGINDAMAARTATLVNAVGAEPDLCLTGGVAKNPGVLAALEKRLSQRIKRLSRLDPQLAGALGAALLAAEGARP